MKTDTFKIIQEKKWISDNLLLSQHGNTLAFLLYNIFCFVSMKICFSQGLY